jgi:hypothetical protein
MTGVMLRHQPPCQVAHGVAGGALRGRTTGHCPGLLRSGLPPTDGTPHRGVGVWSGGAGGRGHGGAQATCITPPGHQAAMSHDLTALWLGQGIAAGGEARCRLYRHDSKRAESGGKSDLSLG